VQTRNRLHTTRNHSVYREQIVLSDTSSRLAIGLGDGTVLLYRRLDQSTFSSSTSLTSLPNRARSTSPPPNQSQRSDSGNPPPPPQTLTQTGMHPTRTKQKTKTDLYLFIITASRVLFSQATGRVPSSSPNTAIVDEVGAGWDARLWIGISGIL